jgi:hypothetical protein
VVEAWDWTANVELLALADVPPVPAVFEAGAAPLAPFVPDPPFAVKVPDPTMSLA